MIYEVAELLIKPGSEARFEAAVAEASAVFRDANGCRSLTLQRCIENRSAYRLVVGWDTVEDHMIGFRESPGFARWRELAGPHFAEAPRVIHVDIVLEAF